MTTRRLYIPAAIFLASFLGVSAANAQDTSCRYNLASLQGKYAIVVTYLPTFAAVAIGTRTYDGAGNMTGTFIVNGPTTGSTTGARTVIKGTQKGTYTVNCDGTGVITRTTTLASGEITTYVDDFVITAAIWNGTIIASTIADVAENPTTSGATPAGLYQTRVQSRLPSSSGQ